MEDLREASSDSFAFAGLSGRGLVFDTLNLEAAILCESTKDLSGADSVMFALTGLLDRALSPLFETS